MHYIVYCFNFSTRNQCLQYCIQISTLLSLFQLTGQPKSQKDRAAKAKDGIISEAKFLATTSIEQYDACVFEDKTFQ
jgi:hypothetical protein